MPHKNPSEIALKKVRKIALSDGRFCMYVIMNVSPYSKDELQQGRS
jgi:hypothetical protein